MSHDALSPHQFEGYHASPHVLPVGTELRPGAERGVNNFPGEGNGDNSKVFLSDSEDDAREWASVIGQKQGHDVVHVYKVAAQNAVGEKGFGGLTEYRADSARVTRHVDSIDPIAHAKTRDDDDDWGW